MIFCIFDKYESDDSLLSIQNMIRGCVLKDKIIIVFCCKMLGLCKQSVINHFDNFQ